LSKIILKEKYNRVQSIIHNSNSSEEELMLASLSNSYFESEIISVYVSRPSSYFSHFLLTISTTNYYHKGNVNDFSLRGLFYSKHGFKNTCCSPVYTDYKRVNSIELIIEECNKYIYTRLLHLLSTSRL